MNRLIDYGLVLLVVLVIMGLFRLSRMLLERYFAKMSTRNRIVSGDGVLFAGVIFLLAGLLFLPFVTALISFVSSDFLPGGMVLHLSLVALSIVVFSISEDLFRVFRDFPVDPVRGRWSVRDHMKHLALPLLVFWVTGSVFLSPLFYSGLSVLLTLFYLYAIVLCRKQNSGEKAQD